MKKPLKKGFQKYIPPQTRTKGRKPGPLSTLLVGESWVFEGKTKKDLYNIVNRYRKKYGFDYDYLQAKNGIVLRRTR